MQLGSRLFVSLMLITALAIGLFVEISDATQAVIVGFTNTAINANTGDTITISIIANPNGNSIQSGELVLSYNSSGLKVEDIAPGDIWGTSPLVVKKEYNESSIMLVVARTGEPATQPGSVLKIRFKVIGNKGTEYQVIIVKANFADDNGNSLPVRIKPSKCVIKVGLSKESTTTTTTPKTTITVTSTKIVTTTKTVTATKTITALKTTTTTVTATIVRTETTTATITIMKTRTETSTKTIIMPPQTETVTATTTSTAFRTITATSTVTKTKSVPVTIKETITVPVEKTITKTIEKTKTETLTKTTKEIITKTPTWSYASLAIAIIVLISAIFVAVRARK